jgi:hypothetical protein
MKIKQNSTNLRLNEKLFRAHGARVQLLLVEYVSISSRDLVFTYPMQMTELILNSQSKELKILV